MSVLRAQPRDDRELERRYGAQQLRVVFKHVPLQSHEGAVPAARVAQALLEMGGESLFFQYLERAYAHQDEVASGDALELALPLGVDQQKLSARAGSAEIGQQVLTDARLADRLDVRGLPHFRVNGRGFTGEYPLALLASAIDAEISESRRLRDSGVPAEQIYSRRVSHNLNLPEQ
ncbi:MAG: DsbA family protein [Polyangiaceae bacterium]